MVTEKRKERDKTEGGHGLIPVDLWNGKKSDVVLTPRETARKVVNRFNPTGKILDPCRGEGAFTEFMPNADWCEIREGRDFFDWKEETDWIISNPPYSLFDEFIRHAFTLADNIVFLVPFNKVFNSQRRLREIFAWGGIETLYVLGAGRSIGFPIGFCCGAVHFKRGYKGAMNLEFSEG